MIISCDAPDKSIPCPARITGFFELLIRFAAFISLFFSGFFIILFPGIFTGFLGYSNSIFSFCKSFGISMRTGPGLPDLAIANASLMVEAKSLISITK